MEPDGGGMNYEKSAWKSKKFLFGIGVELGLFGLCAGIMSVYDEMNMWTAMVLMFLVATIGTVAFGFCGYQAALDRYVRIAEIAGRGEK